jgi:hypothetical protein
LASAQTFPKQALRVGRVLAEGAHKAKHSALDHYLRA